MIQVSHIIDEYRSGRTPNPDVLCNTRIKFGKCSMEFSDVVTCFGCLCECIVLRVR